MENGDSPDSMSFNYRRSVMNEVIDRFNQTIEDRIRSHLQQQLLRRRDPSESTVFLAGVYTPSHVSTRASSITVPKLSTRLGSKSPQSGSRNGSMQVAESVVLASVASSPGLASRVESSLAESDSPLIIARILTPEQAPDVSKTSLTSSSSSSLLLGEPPSRDRIEVR
jgi:hypothetical protein